MPGRDARRHKNKMDSIRVDRIKMSDGLNGLTDNQDSTVSTDH